MTATKITLTLRMVHKDPATNQYVVKEEQESDGSWKTVSKSYTHSTSAFAALGRLMQKEIRSIVEE